MKDEGPLERPEGWDEAVGGFRVGASPELFRRQLEWELKQPGRVRSLLALYRALVKKQDS